MAHNIQRFPLIVYLILIKNDQILLLRRAHTKLFDGFWSLPAGKVEHGETPQQALIREAHEELGITITNPLLKTIITVKSKDTFNPAELWQDVGFFFQAVEYDGVPTNAEPHVHDTMAWFDIHALPEPIIPNVKQGIEQIIQNINYGEWET
jgi:mutator protein MutT